MSQTQQDKAPSDKKPVLLKLKKIKPIAGTSKGPPTETKTSTTCILCRASFLNRKQLEEHFRKHGSEKDKAIPTMKIATTASSLFGPIPCNFCPMILPSLSKAIEHKHRKHIRQGKNYFCEFCGSLFPLELALVRHKEAKQCGAMNRNDGLEAAGVHAKPVSESKVTSISEKDESIKERLKFKCSHCPVEFLTQDALDYHEYSAHKIQQNILNPTFLPPPSTKIKVNDNSEVFSVYYCHLCGSEYISKFNFKKHVTEYHKTNERILPANEELIRCITCESIFFTVRAYEAHTIHHRPDDLYVLSEEHRKQVVNRVDLDFDFRRIPVTNPVRTKRRRVPKMSDQPERKIKKETEDSLSPPSTPSTSNDEPDMDDNKD